MENTKVKEISPRAYQTVIGLLLISISVALCLNTGFFIKFLSFSFAYSLGAGSYVLYFYLFLSGLSILFRGQGVAIRNGKYFCFSLVLLIGLAGLLTYFSINQTKNFISFYEGDGQVQLFDKLNHTFACIAFNDGVDRTYFTKESIVVLLGVGDFGCGLVGYAVLAAGNTILGSSLGGFIFSTTLIVIGAILFAIPFILYVVKRNEKDGENKENQKIDLNSHKRIKNINVIKGAKRIDPNTYRTEVSGAGKNVDEFDEEILENPITDVPVMPFSEVMFQEESLDNYMKEIDPEIESLDGFKDVVFDVGNHEAIVSHDLPENNKNAEPIETSNNFEPEEDPFGEEIVSEKTSNNFFFKRTEEPVREVSKEPVREVISQPVEKSPIYQQPSIQQQTSNVKVEEVKEKKQRVNFTVLNSTMLDTYETAEAAELNYRVALERKDIINNTFKDFGVGAEVVDYTIGPSVTRFNIRYASNVSVRSVSNLVQDISIRLNGVGARFESVIEGQSTSGLEIPNPEITTVAFKDVYDALPNVKKHPLAVAFGKNIKGTVIYADFDEFPHMLVSGTTGSGKSVFVNSIICTLIMRNSPDDLKLVLVDPKKVEMSRYADMPHLLTPIITEPTKVKLVLDKLVDEMEYRYSLFSKNNATNIKEYNEDCDYNGNEKIPYVVVVLDEYADLVEQCKDISYPVVMLAQKARACGIHIMLSTQRPSTNVVTGVIKANMPTHVALMTANYVDSTTIIGEGGAEKLLGKGDMLVQSPLVSRVGVCRLQSCFINRHEISRIVGELKSKYPTSFDSNFLNLEEQKPSEYAPADLPDGGDNSEEAKYKYIKEWVMTQEYMSMSKIQRDCSVGFNRAGRFFNRLQQEGIVATEPEGSKGCKVILQNKFGDIDDDDVIATSEDNSYIKR